METLIAIGIFLICYLFIILEKVNRALVACTGGLFMIILGVYDLEEAFLEYIDWNTIGLLFSMMILVSITSRTGIFEYIAIKLAQKVRGKPLPLLFATATLTALGSAFLDNVTTVLLFVPILLTLTDLLKISPMPYLFVTILASNIGGTATLIGDPPNIMIGQAVDHLTFNDFLFNLAPIVILIYIIVIFILGLFYRKRISISEHDRLKLMTLNPTTYLKKDVVLYRSITVLVMTIISFMLHPILHVELTTVAMAGALLLLLLTHNQVDPEQVFRSVEWVTLFFFIGLFMLVGGLEKSGIIDEIARGILYYTEGDLPKTSLLILWLTGIVSGFVDNIPFVAAMIPVLFEFQDYGMANIDPLWWSLALGACLGGNATLIGSSANVVVAGLAARSNQHIGFIAFLKIGFPVVILSLLISTIYIYFRYLIEFM
jgi:Na+/H+ antiporter NhaD/arsenite permease-like protein